MYGFSVAEARDVEVVFGQAALAILLSTVFYERLRHVHGLQSVESYIRSKRIIHGLKAALGDMLKINYELALQLALEILNEIPLVLSVGISSIINYSLRISEMSHLLARDFSGRIYHEITGDISVRKGFATFYTEVPAAYMLINLVLKTALDIR
ncbi:MAG: hypothetical protein ABIM42_05910 [candidate division WOR-3 bacterium]